MKTATVTGTTLTATSLTATQAATRTVFGPNMADRGSVLMDRQWLDAHLHDAAVRVVEIDVSRVAYQNGHIEGAVLWNIYSDLKDADYRLVDTDAIQRIVTCSGIDADSTVVFYGYAPALGFWLMKLYGHQDVRILDCSRDTWRDEGRPWTTNGSEPAAGSVHLGSVRLGSVHLGSQDPRIRADRAAVREAIGRAGTTLLDVRSEAEYRGERFWPSGGMEEGGQAGHVPSAIHQPIDGLYNDDGSFRSVADLRSIFSSVDLGAGDELITYCTIGGRAATAWFVLTQLLGRERVRVYDGSWAEWGRIPGAPVERQ